MNNNLTLKESLDILNFILRYKEDYDWDCDGIIYISVNYVKSKYLIKELIDNNVEFKAYVRDFLEDASIDISTLWGDVSEQFKVDIWYNGKINKFYMVKWYHKIEQFYKKNKRYFKDWIRKKRETYKIHKYYRKQKKETKKRIKQLTKYYTKVQK